MRGIGWRVGLFPPLYVAKQLNPIPGIFTFLCLPAQLFPHALVREDSHTSPRFDSRKPPFDTGR